MFIYPEINPIAIQFGPISIAWYGLMYLMGFIIAFVLARIRVKQEWSPIQSNQIDDLIYFSVIGVIIGGRSGYMIFYATNTLIEDPLNWLIQLPQLWAGGMSFHGGLIGVLIAVVLFSKKIKKPFIDVIDFVAPLVPIGLGLGRIGNFINGELWGKPTDSQLGFLVNGIVRHPSQLYEAFLEGLVLFIILWVFTLRKRAPGFSAAIFLIFYGCFRFLIEYFRLPDEHIGYLAWEWLTVGQILSIPMLMIGFYIIFTSKIRQNS